MKPKEFQEIKEKFEEEQKRWESLKVDDIIYDSVARWGDMDYHKMSIDSIDIEERIINAHDVEGDHREELGGFITEEEFNELQL